MWSPFFKWCFSDQLWTNWGLFVGVWWCRTLRWCSAAGGPVSLRKQIFSAKKTNPIPRQYIVFATRGQNVTLFFQFAGTEKDGKRTPCYMVYLSESAVLVNLKEHDLSCFSYFLLPPAWRDVHLHDKTNTRTLQTEICEGKHASFLLK